MEDGASQVVRVSPTRNRGGAWVRFGDEEYRVPPLGLNGVQEFQEAVKDLKPEDGIMAPAVMRAMQGALLSALRRNYPDIAEDVVADMIDLENYDAVLQALHVTSARKPPEGEAQASG